jgi:hypothetical protein
MYNLFNLFDISIIQFSDYALLFNCVDFCLRDNNVVYANRIGSISGFYSL